jgi:hypothetical protein
MTATRANATLPEMAISPRDWAWFGRRERGGSLG